jgi:hypothetical protein
MKCVGLTNNPDEIKKLLGNPEDWWIRVFNSEVEARKWVAVLVRNYEYKNASAGDGWKYGFTFTPQHQIIAA